jgi:hypothetical protein
MTLKPHPDIIAFHTERGVVIEPGVFLFDHWFFCHSGGGLTKDLFAYIDSNNTIVYFLNGKIYSEEEMLRMIKLRAFW